MNEEIIKQIQTKLTGINFQANGPSYYIPGVMTVPRVTSIVSYLSSPSGLDKWRNKEIDKKLLEAFKPNQSYMGDQVLQAVKNARQYPFEYTNKAARFGTLCHQWMEDYLNTMQYPPVPEYTEGYADVNKAIESMKKFIIKWQLTPENIQLIKTEAFLYSKVYEYAGNADCILAKGEDIYIMDWKFNNSSLNYTSVKYSAQVSAYAKAFEEMTGHKISRVFVIRFKKDGSEPEVLKLSAEDMERSWMLFKAALMSHRADTGLSFKNLFAI